MKTHAILTLSTLALSAILVTGCAHQSTVHPQTSASRTTMRTTRTTTAAYAPKTAQSPNASIYVSDDLARACRIDFGNSADAPKFNFDQSDLQPQDRNVLDQIAKCVTTGPLAGRDLRLTGRADPRGEVEYNFVLGEHRAAAVDAYLASLGVQQGQLNETSRGKLDATGTDEAGWQRDRRVDISLL